MTTTTDTTPAITFTDESYIPGPGGPGKQAAPNPFDGIVGEIKLKTTDDGKPVAKGYVFEHDSRADESKADDVAREERRIKRLLSEAGEHNGCTVRSVIAPLKNPVNGKDSATKSKVTFWAVKRQERKRKPAPTA